MAKFNLYKPGEDAEKEISNTIITAKKVGKHVFIQVGGTTGASGVQGLMILLQQINQLTLLLMLTILFII